jgi:sorbitol/mannitol transport system permease protein
VLPIYMMAQYTGTLDTRFALIFAYTASNLPVAVWMLQPVFGQVATEQEEAAQLDGASHVRIFFTIVLPMVAAGIATVGLLIFILC